jgi:ParB/RepB/Spo0J family partition protein
LTPKVATQTNKAGHPMVKENKTELAPKIIGVKEIPTSNLHPNPHNPRVLFDREPLDTLKASIRKVGILVPLTVYIEDRRKRYVILDGQRRWTCAKELSIAKVPVNVVAEPTLVQNIVTMFQIHKLREDWELMPTALKLELLMHELDERNDRNLAQLTGLDQAVVQRCKKLLDYPKKYQDMMLDPDKSRRIKADFFIELYAVRNDRFVNSMEWFKQDAFTKAMLDRYSAGKLRAVTDFRTIKQHISNARKANKKRTITARLRDFTDDEDISIDYLAIEDANAVAEARKVTSGVEKLAAQLEMLDVEGCLGEAKLWSELQRLFSLIKDRLRDAGLRIK